MGNIAKAIMIFLLKYANVLYEWKSIFDFQSLRVI